MEPVIIIWLICGLIAAYVYQEKSSGFGIGCVTSFLLGPIGIVLALKGPSSPKEDEWVETDGLFSHDIVGESHYQHNLERICGPRTERGENRIVQARIIWEDDNPYDSQAVAVQINGLMVGHLRRETAHKYRVGTRKLGLDHTTMRCPAKIKGGWIRANGETGHYGVWLDLPQF